MTPSECGYCGAPWHDDDCCICHGSGEFECRCARTRPHVHACGNCTEGERRTARAKRLHTET